MRRDRRVEYSGVAEVQQSVTPGARRRGQQVPNPLAVLVRGVDIGVAAGVG